jgi:predicted nucleotidyltransferase
MVRLSAADREMIRQVVIGRVGEAATVRLFGSRTNDALRGGDIDVFVELSHPVLDRLRLECGLAVDLERALEGRRVDVVVAAPNIAEQPVHASARQHGIVL